MTYFLQEGCPSQGPWNSITNWGPCVQLSVLVGDSSHTITLALVKDEYVASAFSWLCGEADTSPRTNKPQTKPVLCAFISLRVLFLFLFSMGLSFIPEFILNLIWFYNASSILHVSPKHLVYFLFESDMIGALYRSPFVIKEKQLEIL